MRTVIVIIALWLAGCADAFDLVEVSESPGATCAYAEPLDPDADEDGDGTLNAADLCPRSLDPDPHDEDGDRIPDACDPCPMFSDAGEDADCDQIGAACDPDDTVPHVQKFFGFASTAGLDPYEVEFADDTVAIPIAGERFGDLFVQQRVDALGVYETAGTLEALDGTYIQTTLVIHAPGPDTSNYYQIALVTYDEVGFLRIDRAQGPASSVDVPAPASGAAYRIVAVVTSDRIVGTLTGYASAMVEYALPAPLVSIEYGLDAYRDETTTSARSISRYLRRVAVAP